LRLENRFQLFSQFGPRRNAYDDLAFLFGFLQSPFPFLLPVSLGEEISNRAAEKRRSES
jgi:hypothetical protein